ncbi:MAG: DUF2085 domain-containing protein [Deltaproteobacteria bacterium]|nr:DUF2085 domain-containing protein [Deltaproteobacteria bacterium]
MSRALRALLLGLGLLPWVLGLLALRHPAWVAAFRGLCHQRPERSLWLRGAPMVVCSRCAGLYLGVALGALLPLPSRWLAHGRSLLLWALLVTALEVLAQDSGLHAPWHPSRMGTGLLLGWVASGFMTASLRAREALPPA